MKRTNNKFELPIGYKEKLEKQAHTDIYDILQEFGGIDFQMFMNRLSRLFTLQEKYKPQLRDLAEESILHYYSSILEGVDLVIKFPDDIEEIIDEMSETPDSRSTEDIKDKNTLLEIKKRKIANNIIQGEAKNTKLILNDTYIRDKLVAIMGHGEGDEMLKLLTEITKIAGFFDWTIPIEIQQKSWQEDKSRLAGCESVDWKPEDDKEEDFTPGIKAVGKDFIMLLHESVKGIYELIAASGIPKDYEIAKTVIQNTDTLEDELVDLRYGPYIAADIRDYINTFTEIDKIKNLRERVFGKMIMLPAAKFLDLIEYILTNDNRANLIVQLIIDDISSEIKEYHDLDDDALDSTIHIPTENIVDNIIEDLEEDLSENDIRNLIDEALDIGDMLEVDRLAKKL